MRLYFSQMPLSFKGEKSSTIGMTISTKLKESYVGQLPDLGEIYKKNWQLKTSLTVYVTIQVVKTIFSQ